MEILDSRYEQFRYFSMEDVIADNSSSSHFILGPEQVDFAGLPLDHLTMNMKVNGETVREGNSSAISGDPVLSLLQLSELLSERGHIIPAGSIILAGAATAAVGHKTGNDCRIGSGRTQKRESGHFPDCKNGAKNFFPLEPSSAS